MQATVRLVVVVVDEVWTRPGWDCVGDRLVVVRYQQRAACGSAAWEALGTDFVAAGAAGVAGPERGAGLPRG